ncbi:MAG: glycosyltransferase [Acidobacteriota bacterium]
MDLLFLAALVSLPVSLGIAAELVLGGSSLRFLRDMPLAESFPRVSVLIAARNEERNVEQALRSVLSQDYPDYEVIVVDDRSTDRTGEILDEISRAHPVLRVVHLKELPSGWLGKNHALHDAALHASGEYLLFTDADVVMDPTTLSRAVRRMEEKGLDHLTLGPDVIMPGFLLNMFAGFFTILFSLYARPWRANKRRSRCFVGIGAFNMLKASVYRSIGTHRAIAMRPDDDMKLGKLVKKSGYKQEFLHGHRMIAVEWYSSVSEMIHGLEKNSFAGVEYNVFVIAGAIVMQITLFIWPFVAFFTMSGGIWLLNALIVAIWIALYRVCSEYSEKGQWYGPLIPLASCLFMVVILNSTYKTLSNDGINWRGTHYPLSELKANRV